MRAVSILRIRRSNDSREKGSFIIFAALVIAVLLGFVALSIDAARTLTSMSEKISTADSVALAALDAYLNKDKPPGALAIDRHNYKWNQAKLQAVEFANKNVSTFIDAPKELAVTDIGPEHSGIEMKPGRWWVERPATCDEPGGTKPACPCAQLTSPLSRPCFQECQIGTGCSNPGSGGDIFATAMEVKLSTEAEGGIPMLFARLFGIDTLNVEGRAFSAATGSVAYALPQVHVLLFDLSRSMTIDNYLPFERNPVGDSVIGTDRQEYSFPLAGLPAMGCDSNGVASTCNQNCPIALTATTPNTSFSDEYALYGAGKWSQYTCYSGSRNGVAENYLVATGTGVASRNAEPYTSLLNAANQFLTQFRLNGRGGDKVMLLGFDNQDVKERHFPAAAADGSPVFLDPNDPKLDELIQMTANKDQAARRMFFPRAESKLDLTKALTAAASQILAAYPAPKIDASITLFSNGFSLCSAKNPPSYGQYCADLTPASAGMNEHMRHYEKQTASMDEALVTVAENLLKPNRIKVNVISGNESMPPGRSAIPTHNAMIGHWTDSRCATDIEFRKKKYMYVIPYPQDALGSTFWRDRAINEFANIGRATASAIPVPPTYNDGILYVQPSKFLYGIAATTLGQYVEIRPECPGLNITTANSRCNTTRLANIAPSFSNRIAVTRSYAWKPLVTAGNGINPSNEVDWEGRLMCEPQNGPASQPGAVMNKFSLDATNSRLVSLVMPD